jgi:polyphosphate glucokinase
MKTKYILGIDIGGSGIKGAIVNTSKGKLKTKRYRIPTPESATPEVIAGIIKKITNHFKWKGIIGIGFPGVVQNGVIKTAANMNKVWIDVDIVDLISRATKCPTFALNDADAAGFAEMKFGSGKGFKGVAVLITVGTGLGSVMFSGGKLVPNLEFGHIILHGDSAEKYASDAARQQGDLSWEEWAGHFNEYLTRLEFLTWPDLIIIGGGASKKDDLFMPYLKSRARIVPAELLNEAGIIGAAMFAKSKRKQLH